MSKLELGPEALHRVLDGHEIQKYDLLDIASDFKNNSKFVFRTSERLRNKNKANIVSFSKKSFCVEIHAHTVPTNQR